MDASDVADTGSRHKTADLDAAATCEEGTKVINNTGSNNTEEKLFQPRRHLQQMEAASNTVAAVSADIGCDTEVQRSIRPPGHGGVRPASANVRHTDMAVLKDVVTSLPMRRTGQSADVEEGGKTGDSLLKTRHFKKAKSAATFMLDGVSYNSYTHGAAQLLVHPDLMQDQIT